MQKDLGVGRILKKVKCCITITVFVIVILSNVTNVSALKLGGKLIKGPRNMTYTVNGDAAAYTNNINGAQYGAREILNVKTNKTVFRTVPEIKNLQVKNNNTNEYESLSNLIQLYFK